MQYYARHTCLDCRGAGCVYCRGEGSILLPNWIAYNEIEDEHNCRRCKVNIACGPLLTRMSTSARNVALLINKASFWRW
jgi:hypothetical protein